MTSRRATAMALALLVIMALAHVAPALLNGRTFVRNDYGIQFLPAFATLHGRLPIAGAPSWNPTIFGGAPEELLPAMPRYPFAAMAYFVAPERAVPLFVGLHLAIAALAAFVFLRVVVRASVVASFAGAEVYAFGGTLWVHGMHGENLAVAAWLPAIAAAAWALGARRDRRPYASAALAGATSLALLVGGGVPLLFFSALTSAVCLGVGLLEGGNSTFRGVVLEARRAAPWILAGLGLAMAIGAPGWIPFAEVIRGAARGTLTLGDTGEFALAPPLLMRLAAPNLCYEDGACVWPYFVERWCYFGILALPLAGLGAFGESGRRLLLALFATVLLSFGTIGLLHVVFYWLVPGYSFLRAPGRWMFVAGLLVAILVARGLDEVPKRAAGTRRALGAMIALVLISLAARAAWEVAPQDPMSAMVRADFAWTAVFATLAAGWLAASLTGMAPAKLPAIAAALLAADLLVTAARVDASDPIADADAPSIVSEAAAAAGPARIFHDDDTGGFILDSGVRWGYRNARGYSQLVPETWSRMLDLGETRDWNFSGAPARPDPRLLSLLGVRVYLGSELAAPPASFAAPPVAHGLGLAAWASGRPAFLSALVAEARVEPVGDAERAAALEIDPNRTAIVTSPAGLPQSAGLASAGTITLSRPSSDELVAHVDATVEALAVVAESWHPRWCATVDGIPGEVLRADAIWMGVRVSPGAHEIVFRCRPAVPVAGWLASLAGIGGTIALVWRGRRRAI